MWGDKFENVTTLPQWEIAPYLLVALYQAGGVAHGKDVIKRTLDLLDISDELRDRPFGKVGELTYIQGQTSFAMSILRRAGYVKTPKDSSKAGSWELASKGIESAKDLNDNFEDAKIVEGFRNELEEIVEKRDKEKKAERESEGAKLVEAEGELGDRDVDEELDEHAREREGIRADIQFIHDNLEPLGFEQLCVRLLNAMDAKMGITPGSHDHGVDAKGFIKTDLIIYEVAAQFKRYDLKTPIGERYINELAGSMGSADRGIFITTSYYSKNAEEAAQKHSIRLIDGEELVELMREHEIMYKRVLDLES